MPRNRLPSLNGVGGKALDRSAKPNKGIESRRRQPRGPVDGARASHISFRDSYGSRRSSGFPLDNSDAGWLCAAKAMGINKRQIGLIAIAGNRPAAAD